MNDIIEKIKLPDVKKIIGVASGKGGVGKSSVSANLALYLSSKGYKTAIFDADIYGPSIPIIFNVETLRPEIVQIGDDEKLIPIVKNSVQIMSIGFFLDAEQPVIWRGPVASNYMKTCIENTLWKDVDYLIVDLPPGTGDIALTLCQSIPLDGVLIVTTPQLLSIADVQKSLNMFKHKDINVPILGIVENMAWFTPAAHADEKYFLFGKGGGSYIAEKFETELLAQIPLIDGLCLATENGGLSNFNSYGILDDAYSSILKKITNN